MDDLEDQIKRETIPDPDSIPTQHRPWRNFIMVQMLPNPNKIGKIFLPSENSIKADACEGHVMHIGPSVSKDLEQGDCITFEKQYAVNFEIDGFNGGEAAFTMIPENAIILRIPHAVLRQSAKDRNAKKPKRPSAK